MVDDRSEVTYVETSGVRWGFDIFGTGNPVQGRPPSRAGSKRFHAKDGKIVQFAGGFLISTDLEGIRYNSTAIGYEEKLFMTQL
jgi:hypothetical protein